MKIEAKIELEHRLHERVKQRLKDRINDRMNERIMYFQNKNKTLNNVTKYKNFKNYPEYFPQSTTIKQLEEFKNSSDFDAMWEIAIDNWTRN